MIIIPTEIILYCRYNCSDFIDRETEAQRDTSAHPASHCWEPAELGSSLRALALVPGLFVLLLEQ